MIVYDSTVSERYAHALFNVSKRQGTLPAAIADAEQFLALNKKDSRLAVFLEGPQFRTEDKLAMVKRAFEGKLEPLLVQLIILLINKGRIEYARPILNRFVELAEADQGLHPAEVTTANELSDEQKERLQKGLEGFAKAQLRIRWRVEPSLIAGVRFTMGDLLIDDTIKGKLDKLRYQLQEAARA